MGNSGGGGSVIVLSLYLLIVVGWWVCQALAWSAIARKCDEPTKAWWAWVPGANFLLILYLADVDPLWLAAFLVPPGGLIILVWCGWTISESLGQPTWLALLFPLPPLNLAAFAYLA